MNEGLPKGEMENESFHRCRQTQCGYFLNGGCQACAECAAAPFEIRKSCQRCFGCENVPNELRWDPKDLIQVKTKQQVKQKKEEKVIEVHV